MPSVTVTLAIERLPLQPTVAADEAGFVPVIVPAAVASNAVFVIVPVALGFTFTVMLAELVPVLRKGAKQVTVPVPGLNAQLPSKSPLPTTDTKLVAAGKVSVNWVSTPLLLPLLVTDT